MEKEITKNEYQLEDLSLMDIKEDELESIINIILIISNSDGDIADEEIEVITNFIDFNGMNSNSKIIELINSFLKQNEQDTDILFKKSLEKIKNISNSNKEVFLNWINILIISDNIIDNNEIKYLSQITSYFNFKK